MGYSVIGLEVRTKSVFVMDKASKYGPMSRFSTS